MSHARMKVFRTARKIVIELPLSVLPKALYFSPQNVDSDGDPAYHVTNKAAFADAVVEALGREEEDGTTLMHRLFDDAMLAAIEDGGEGVEEYERSKRRRERDRKARLADRRAAKTACRVCGEPADHEHPCVAALRGGQKGGK